MSLLAIVLIPQVLFTAPAVHMDMQGVAGVAARAMPTWWAFDLLRRVALRDAESASDETVQARLQRGGRTVLLSQSRVDRMLRDDERRRYGDRLEIARPASTPERWGQAVPLERAHARAAVVDLLALAAFAVLLFALVLARAAREAHASG
jgi:hypothetical protein